MDSLITSLGLSEKQRAIFMVLLSRGAVAASQVARICALPRNTARGLLDEMVRFGIVARSKRGNVHYYQLEDSAGMVRALRAQQESLNQEYERRVESIAEHEGLLARRSPQGKRPKVYFYEGTDGLKKVYEDTLASKEPLRSWGNFDANQEAMPAYFRGYYRRRAAKGLKIKSLHPDTPLARAAMRRNRAELRDAKIVPRAYRWEPEIQVYEDKVNIVSWNERVGIIVESEEVAHAVKSIFDLCFNSLKGK